MSADSTYIPPLNWIQVQGADLTGSTDSTAAITSALTAASTSTQCRTVYLGPGLYKCNIVIPAKVRLIGAGSSGIGDWDGGATGATTLIPNSDASPVVAIQLMDQNEIRDLNIRGNGSGTSALGLKVATAIDTTPGYGLTCEGVVISDFTTGYYVTGATNTTFTRSAFIDCDRCIHLHNGPDTQTFIGCSIGGGYSTGTAIYIDSHSQGVNIINCEMGNTQLLLDSIGNSQVNFYGGNVEGISSSYLVSHTAGWIGFYGTYFLLDNTAKVLVRSTANYTEGITVAGILCNQWATYGSTGRQCFVETTQTAFRPKFLQKGCIRYVTDGTFTTDLRIEDERILPFAADGLLLGATGVTLSDDGDGALTITGRGNGSNESITLNLDDTSNTVTLSTSTGVTVWDFGPMGIKATGGLTLEPDASTLDNINVIKRSTTNDYSVFRHQTGATIDWDAGTRLGGSDYELAHAGGTTSFRFGRTTFDFTNIFGNVIMSTAGKGLRIKEGSNARLGTATMVGGTIAVANTSVTASTRILYSRTTTGGTLGDVSLTQTNGVGFTLNSTSGTETSTFNWMLVEPSA